MRYRARVYAGERLSHNQSNWHFEVRDSEGRLMAKDDTGDWEVIYKDADNLVRTLRELETRGFKIKQPKWLRGK